MSCSNPLLERMSAHIDHLAAKVFDLEQVAASHLDGGGAVNNSSIEEFQTLDYLRQTLEDLSVLSLLLARTESGTPTQLERIAAKMRLNVTKCLVLGTDVMQDPAETAASGEVDLF